MKELFYFSFADLMARIEYDRTANALRYATHRTMTFQERMLVEQHLLVSFAQKTEYFERDPALFIYLGTDEELAQMLEEFHARNSLQGCGDKEITAAVGNLIAQSLERYYFEQIGEALLQARHALAENAAGDNLLQRDRRKAKLQELIDAYNHYTAQKITLAEIVPAELKPCFGLPQEDGDEQRGGRQSENWRNHVSHT